MLTTVSICPALRALAVKLTRAENGTVQARTCSCLPLSGTSARLLADRADNPLVLTTADDNLGHLAATLSAVSAN